ncbi:hypothetical protein B0H11DRAFT_1902316 [Mycena galericulata]|nr:hypothetical protein B0H11DRAFT_1902316 [Mycena galericulata]
MQRANGSSKRFHPYRRPVSFVSPPSPPSTGWLSDAFHNLVRINIDGGRLCTWDHGITDTWIEVPRPQRVTSKGPVDLAARSFKKVWMRDGSPFFCPHTTANGLRYKPLVLRLEGLYNGGVADYFQAVDHPCAFKVVVPALKQTNYLVSWEDRDRYQEENEEEQEEENTRSSSPISSFSSSPRPSSQISSSSSVSSNSSSISHLAVEALLNPDPRYGPRRQDPFGGSRPRPTPVAKGTVLESPRMPKPFFSLAVANARKMANIEVMEYILQIDSSGLLAEEPFTHPAWDPEDPHPLLRIYDKRIYPHSLSRTHSHLGFLYKPIGQAIRELNSLLGIPYHDYASIIRSTVACDGCKLHFSPDGYNDHIQEGHCTNHPDLMCVDECVAFTAVFQFRSFRDGRRPERFQETLDTPVGAALLEWNSRVGVPTDVRAAGQQRGSTDLVVYSVALEDVVQVAWPVVGISRVPPHLIREYLRRLNVFWPCFCAKLVVYTQPHKSLSCRIMTGSCGSFALCHYDEPRCQFFLPYPSKVNLDSIFLSATFEDQYQRLAGPAPAHLGPYTRGESYSPGEYVAGYLGDPGDQLGKLVIADDLFEERLGGYLRTMASIAIDATSPVGNDALYPQESNLFAKLCSGEAVPQAALKNLFSHCKALQ